MHPHDLPSWNERPHRHDLSEVQLLLSAVHSQPQVPESKASERKNIKSRTRAPEPVLAGCDYARNYAHPVLRSVANEED